MGQAGALGNCSEGGRLVVLAPALGVRFRLGVLGTEKIKNLKNLMAC